MAAIKLSKDILDKVDEKIEKPEYLDSPPTDMILHLGVGNFHRSHQAYYLHKLLQLESSGWNICGAGLMPQDRMMGKALAEQDFLYTLVTQESGMEQLSIVGSIRDFIHIPAEIDKYSETCSSDRLSIISLTITEKGYCFDNNMNLDTENSGIRHDTSGSDETPVTAIGALAFGLRQRMLAGGNPLTVLSCDNIPENGSVLKRILFQFVEMMNDKELLDYLRQDVSFPCTMVDRITPTTTDDKRNYLADNYSIRDAVPVFSELYIQWVVEDDFKAGRPEWEKAGATFVQDVKPYELMKIRLLNGGHSALAYLSLLAGYYYVDDAMNDGVIRSFVHSYMNELKTTLAPIPGVDYDGYIRNLLKRFANPAVRDRLLRLAEDGSTKFLNCTVGPMISLLEKGKDVSNIARALAGWIVYLQQSSDKPDFEVKDPIAEKLQTAASGRDVLSFLAIQEVFPKEILGFKNFTAQLSGMVEFIREKGAIAFLSEI